MVRLFICLFGSLYGLVNLAVLIALPFESEWQTVALMAGMTLNVLAGIAGVLLAVPIG